MWTVFIIMENLSPVLVDYADDYICGDILCICPDEASAQRMKRKYVRKYRPAANPPEDYGVGSAYRPVRCIQTGVVYKSSVTAARRLGLRLSAVNAVLNGTWDNVRGYNFEYAPPGTKYWY